MSNTHAAIPYSYMVHFIQSPLRLAALTWASGFKVPNTQGPFTYADFGCGYGMSLIMLAKAMPDAQFYGFDYHPKHISSAQDIAKDLDVQNVTFIEADFSKPLDYDLPPLDFAVSHGVLSWITKDIRSKLLETMAHFLKPGGICFVSHNMAPGWGEKPALRELLKQAEHLGVPIRDILEAGGKVLDITSGSGTASRAGWPPNGVALENNYLGYLHGEYLADSWEQLSNRQVVQEMSQVGLDFVGPRVSDFGLRDISERPFPIEDPIFWEDYDCLVSKRPFQSVIYRKPVGALPEPEYLTSDPDIFLSLLPGKVNLSHGEALVVSAMGGGQSPHPSIRLSDVFHGLDEYEKHNLIGTLLTAEIVYFSKDIQVNRTKKVGAFKISESAQEQIDVLHKVRDAERVILVTETGGMVVMTGIPAEILISCSGIPPKSFPAALSHVTYPAGSEPYSLLMHAWQKYWAPWLLAHGIIQEV